MQIGISAPSESEILHRTRPVPIARDEEQWSKSCIGEFSGRNGVYVHCSGNKILYVGKTSPLPAGSFLWSTEVSRRTSDNARRIAFGAGVAWRAASDPTGKGC